MNGRSQRVQAFEQGWRGSVEEFIANAKNLPTYRGGRRLPAPITDYFLQRHSVSRPAPGSDNDFGINAEDLLARDLTTRGAHEIASRSRD